MAIYIDVIWFLNYCIDLLIIILTAIVLKRKLVKWRLLLGALIASLPIFLLVTEISYVYYQPYFKFILSILIVLASFGFKRFSFLLQNLFVFYFITFVCGGGLVGLHYFFNTEAIILNGVIMTKTTGFGTPASWLFVIIGFPIIWLYSRKRLTQIEIRKIKYDEIVSVTININEITLQLNGLIDSGNQLYDPLTKKPVIIIDMNVVQEKFPKVIVEQANNPEMIGDPKYPIPDEWERIMTIIPFRGIGQLNQFIIGVKPNSVIVKTSDGQAFECPAIVGLNFTNLSADGDFECIVHPDMFLKGKTNISVNNQYRK